MQVMYKSEGKAPNNDPFLTVKKARGYYEYSERPGYDSIAFILYDGNRFGLINESKPPMDEREGHEVKMTTAFGGSIDINKSYKEICQIEVLEESGYEVPLDRITSVGKTLVSTQMSQMCELFLVDVSQISKTHKAEYEMDPSKDENGEFVGNSIVWMSSDEVMENAEWKSVYILAQGVIKGIL